MTDRLAHWRANLAGQQPKIYEDQPQDGWYMRRLKAKGPFVAAAIWLDVETGEQVCRVGNQMRNVKTEWMWLSKNPCTEESATHFWTHGKWPDGATSTPSGSTAPQATDGTEPGSVATYQDDDATAPAREAKPGDNIKDDGDSFATMARECTAATDNARTWLRSVGATIASEEASKAATDHIGELRKAVKSVEAWKEVNVAPLYQSYKAELKRANDTIEPLEKAIAHLLKLMTAWQIAERDRLRALEEKREAEAKRIEAENVAKLKEAEAAPLLAEPVQLEAVPEKIDTRANVKGFAGGRTIALRTYSEYVIDDFAKALRAVKDEPEIREAMLDAAKRLHKTGDLPKGFKIEQKERAA